VGDRVLVLRTCKREPDGRLTAYGGFVWPESGPVESPDWNPEPTCGGGLHGLLWGKGDGALLNWDHSATWLVVAVDDASIVDLGGKVKYPRGEVVFCGDRGTATDYLAANLPTDADPALIVGATITASGDSGTATASGYWGTATASGYSGTATASGDRGTATASGHMGTATASGHMGTAIASGYSGTATASGDRGTATASGDWGTATATGYVGTATAGPNGVIVLAWHDGVRKRLVVGYVGEGGIEPGRAYRLDASGKIVEATK
jgi:hypothetical protein